MTKAQKQEQFDAIETLKGWIKPGDTVYTVLRSVSRSGMSREISPLITLDGAPFDCGYQVGRALGLTHGKSGGLKIGGCGMDMGFHLVYNLSSVLYGGGYACLGPRVEGVHGERCPSNYHMNHRNTVRCEGPSAGSGLDGFCWAPRGAREAPDGWPTVTRELPPELIGLVRETRDAHCVTRNENGDEIPPVICPRCEGHGSYPNPEGPERFDLVHTDGYALRHRWI